MFRRTLMPIALLLLVVGLAPSATFGQCVDQVPTLTGNSSAVTTSGTYSSSYPAWKAFDGNTSGSSMWISETWETPAWIAYNFGSTRRITQYTLRNSNGPVLTSRAPKDFTLQGRNLGSWVTLDTRTNQTGWISGTPRTYNVASPGDYREYRLRITDDNDSRAGVVVISLSDVQFRACSTPLSVTVLCLSTSEGDQHYCGANASGGSGGYQYSWSYFGEGTMTSSGSTADVTINNCSGTSLNVISVTVTDSSGATASDFEGLSCNGNCSGFNCD